MTNIRLDKQKLHTLGSLRSFLRQLENVEDDKLIGLGMPIELGGTGTYPEVIETENFVYIVSCTVANSIREQLLLYNEKEKSKSKEKQTPIQKQTQLS